VCWKSALHRLGDQPRLRSMTASRDLPTTYSGFASWSCELSASNCLPTSFRSRRST
jgi:hypothetical protein